MIFISVTTMAVLSGETFAALPAQCNPGYLDELPPRLRKICIAIARIWDVRDMNDFVDDRGNRNCQLNYSLYHQTPCEANDSLIYLRQKMKGKCRANVNEHTRFFPLFSQLFSPFTLIYVVAKILSLYNNFDCCATSCFAFSEMMD